MAVFCLLIAQQRVVDMHDSRIRNRNTAPRRGEEVDKSKQVFTGAEVVAKGKNPR